MATLTRPDLARRIAEITGQPASPVDQVLRHFLEAVRLAVASGDTVDLHQFGAFGRVSVAERAGRDPTTGGPIVIPQHHRVQFRPFAALRTSVRGGAELKG